MCIMNISQTIYTQYRPFCQTKCLPIFVTFQFAKLNVYQIYVYMVPFKGPSMLMCMENTIFRMCLEKYNT